MFRPQEVQGDVEIRGVYGRSKYAKFVPGACVRVPGKYIERGLTTLDTRNPGHIAHAVQQHGDVYRPQEVQGAFGNFIIGGVYGRGKYALLVPGASVCVPPAKGRIENIRDGQPCSSRPDNLKTPSTKL